MKKIITPGHSIDKTMQSVSPRRQKTTAGNAHTVAIRKNGRLQV